ncbi:hypothetical protein H696_00200 [Fonticula alba]|uniref:Adenosinetriphosphatase n=1 Tax=Fonticula alba TaxID=691883 RepID=A0A058ZF84_FONAL|nr:hypothetical protein H696_00200 [Fonticula alba]KCV72616.1 hypothetical protein H696_00200 [Fonticula alba]|eukprot:XP_009492317.1 hypothetical protein H696_00200 [Fonticula alba]
MVAASRPTRCLWGFTLVPGSASEADLNALLRVIPDADRILRRNAFAGVATAPGAADARHAGRRRAGPGEDEDEDDAFAEPASGATTAGRARAAALPASTRAALDDAAAAEIAAVYASSPSFIQHMPMRPYQLHGLGWMARLDAHAVGGILADEMGLGKTLQTISLLGHLKHSRGVRGPHLVIAPKSTLQNWQNEFKRWCPSLNIFVLHGSKDDRPKLINERLLTGSFEVCVTSPEMVLVERGPLRRIPWYYIILDEAHRIKNEKSSLARIMRQISSRRRLLITGTPLQNNLHELWALLNFILPDLFARSEDFDSWFAFTSTGEDEQAKEQVVNRLQKASALQQQSMNSVEPAPGPTPSSAGMVVSAAASVTDGPDRMPIDATPAEADSLFQPRPLTPEASAGASPGSGLASPDLADDPSTLALLTEPMGESDAEDDVAGLVAASAESVLDHPDVQAVLHPPALTYTSVDTFAGRAPGSEVLSKLELRALHERLNSFREMDQARRVHFLLHQTDVFQCVAPSPKLINERLLTGSFEVCVTSPEMVLVERGPLRRIPWYYIILDEAHRIKNEKSSLARIMRQISSRRRLLITGTPLQNNLHELWALLNFILPDLFARSEDFDSWFAFTSTGEDEQAKEQVVNRLQKILHPFLLRRLKADVEKSLLPKIDTTLYIGMSPLQAELYERLLMRDLAAVNGVLSKGEAKTRLLNIVMQLRKCCNHPYLFDGIEPGPPYTTGMHLVESSGKMMLLDKLMTSLKAKGSRVLIFSQMARMLDILEDYCLFRGHAYCRIDGQTPHEDRQSQIDAYNAPGSEKFAFLLTTRAGGLGINLYTADTVVLFDSDWNPQADLQAQDRAHRIGQRRQVRCYRFVTESSVEEKMIERAEIKLRLDRVVIQQGGAEAARAMHSAAAASKDELLGMIQHGARELLNARAKASATASEEGTSAGADGTGTADGASEPGDGAPAAGASPTFKAITSVDDLDLDALLEHGNTKTRELHDRLRAAGLDALETMSLGGDGASDRSVYEWGGEDYRDKRRREEEAAAAAATLLAVDPNQETIGGFDAMLHASGLGGAILAEPLQSRRNQKISYNVDEYYRDALATGGRAAGSTPASPPVPRAPRPPRQVADYHFYPVRFLEIQQQELLHFWRTINYRPPEPSTATVTADTLARYPDDDPETQKARLAQALADAQREHQALCGRIAEAEPLTEEVVAERDALAAQGFPDWSQRDFRAFVRACERHGREAVAAIAEELAASPHDKSPEEVRAYATAFWSAAAARRSLSQAEWDRVLGQIGRGETRRGGARLAQMHLERKVAAYADPLRQLRVAYGAVGSAGGESCLVGVNAPSAGAAARGRLFSEEEDRFLVVALARIGYPGSAPGSSADDAPAVYERLQRVIRAWPAFRFNWFIRTRSVAELTRRCQTLVACIEREHTDAEAGRVSGSPAPTSGIKRSASTAAVAGSDDDPLSSGRVTPIPEAAAPAKKRAKKEPSAPGANTPAGASPGTSPATSKKAALKVEQ